MLKKSSSKSADTDSISKFWVDNFHKNGIVDWDVFINTFSVYIQKTHRMKLQEIQKNQIKRIVDPSNQQQIKIKNFNQFIEDYWILPINQQKLFKKHFKPYDTQYQNGFKGIEFSITVQQLDKNVSNTTTYLFKNDTLKYNNQNTALINKGFVNIGSSEKSDVVINSIFVNPFHFKIFKHPLGYKIKDISKSTRAKLKINKPLLLKPGMVFSLSKLNLYPENNGILNVDICQQMEEQADDSTLTFIIKNTQNREQKNFMVGKSPHADAVLDDIRAQMTSFFFTYNNQSWVIDPKQELELHMATLSQLKNHQDSVSLFAETNMRVQFKHISIDFKLIKN